MLITTIKYLMLLTTGFVLGFIIYAKEPAQINLIEENSNDVVVTNNELKPLLSPESALAQKSNEPLQQQESTTKNTTNAALQQQIIQLKAEIAKLKIDQLNRQNKSGETSKKLKILSLDEFNLLNNPKRNKNRFNGIAVTLDDEILENIHQELILGNQDSEWGVEYKQHISTFINQKDPDDLYFIDELFCNDDFCRLKVLTDEPESWQEVYASMVYQAWYQSITFIENSNNANVFIYYIPKPKSI